MISTWSRYEAELWLTIRAKVYNLFLNKSNLNTDVNVESTSIMPDHFVVMFPVDLLVSPNTSNFISWKWWQLINKFSKWKFVWPEHCLDWCNFHEEQYIELPYPILSYYQVNNVTSWRFNLEEKQLLELDITFFFEIQRIFPFRIKTSMVSMSSLVPSLTKSSEL